MNFGTYFLWMTRRWLPSILPLGPKLGHEELDDMLQAALHHVIDLLTVYPQRLLGPLIHELWGLHCTLLLLDEVRVLRREDVHDTVEHVLVCVVGLAVIRVVLLTVGGLKIGDDPPLLCEAGVICTTPLQRPGGIEAKEQLHSRDGRQR